MIYLLETSNKIEDEKKEFHLNMTKAYLNYSNKDFEKGDFFINKNIALQKEYLETNPNDTLKLIDLFLLESHIYEQEEVIKKIEEYKLNHKKPSSFFYENILNNEIYDFYNRRKAYIYQKEHN